MGETPILQMTEASLFSIEIHRISDVDPFDRLTQVRMGCFDQEVKMRGHEAVGMHLDSVPFYRLADIRQNLFPIPLAPEYVHSRVSAIHYVIESTWKFYS
jgi:hypothetical protein